MLNKAILIGNMGADIEVKPLTEGKMGKLRLATSKKVKGEDRTQWHNVIIWDEKKVDYLASYAKTGTKIYVEGEIETRQYEQDGQKKWITEIVVGRFDSKVQILAGGRSPEEAGMADRPVANAHDPDMHDEIPF